MTRGLSRAQIGVTEEMIRTFGDTVFTMSHNMQVRRGDPIRLLDYEAIEAQREGLGLSDAQIAERIGLTRDQVLYIRTLVERRRFRTGHYARLLELGGGRRFRAERFTPHLDHFTFSENALVLRSAMTFDPTLARKYVASGWWRDDTLSGWLATWAERTPDRPAIVAGETTLSYGALAEAVTRLAGSLSKLGLGKGDVISIQLPNCPEFLIAYLAVASLGAVMSTIHMPYRGHEIEALLRHSGAHAVICLSAAKDFKPAEAMLKLQATLPDLETVIALGPAVEGTSSLTELIETGTPVEAGMPPVGSDPFLLLYTSGTTEQPKGVPLSYHNMLSNARLGVPEHGITADEIILSAAPFSHLFGLYSFHLALAAGATNLLLPVFTPPDLAALLAAAKPDVLFSAPAHLAACLGAGLFDMHDISSLRLAIVSGSACAPDLARAFMAKLPAGTMSQLWGMTETQGGLYTRPDDPPEVAATSAGRPSPGTEVRIVDGDGAEVGDGEEGELQVRGCLLFPGYFKNPEATEASFAEDGWFRSGDLAVRDADGNVSITGRLKDIINRGGVKFNPRDIEDLLDGHPKIQQSAIVPMADPVLGEKACCFAVLADGAALTLEEICVYLLEREVAKNKLPERLEIIDEMPLTPTRKIIKGRLAPRQTD